MARQHGRWPWGGLRAWKQALEQSQRGIKACGQQHTMLIAAREALQRGDRQLALDAMIRATDQLVIMSQSFNEIRHTLQSISLESPEVPADETQEDDGSDGVPVRNLFLNE